MNRGIVLVLAMVGLGAAASVVVQIPLLERTDAHERLDFLIGRWSNETRRFLPVEMQLESETTYTWKYGSPVMVQFHARWKDGRTLVLDTGDIHFAGRPHRAVQTFTRPGADRVRKELQWSWDHSELQTVAISELRRISP